MPGVPPTPPRGGLRPGPPEVLLAPLPGTPERRAWGRRRVSPAGSVPVRTDPSPRTRASRAHGPGLLRPFALPSGHMGHTSRMTGPGEAGRTVPWLLGSLGVDFHHRRYGAVFPGRQEQCIVCRPGYKSKIDSGIIRNTKGVPGGIPRPHHRAHHPCEAGEYKPEQRPRRPSPGRFSRGEERRGCTAVNSPTAGVSPAWLPRHAPRAPCPGPGPSRRSSPQSP